MKTLGISQDTGSFLLIDANGLTAIGSYIEFTKVHAYRIKISWPIQKTVIAPFIILSTLVTGSGIHRGSTRRLSGIGLFDFVTNWCPYNQDGSSFPGVKVVVSNPS